jgi:hypothetical protein
MPLDTRLIEILDFLRPFGKYSLIIDNIETSDSPKTSFIFEALFAYALERHEISPDYEVNVTPHNNSTIDFVYAEAGGNKLCFELLSPDMSDELREQCIPTATEIEGISKWEVLLEGSHPNPYLRPEALTIRMQEKLLEKIDKFPDPSDDIFSVISINCESFHFGRFDGEDARMVMYGRTVNSIFQEFWDGEPIKGLLDDSLIRRGSREFRERISAAIFIPNIDAPSNILDGSILILNHRRSRSHLRSLINELKKWEVFKKLRMSAIPA